MKSILAELDHMSEDWKRRLAAKTIATGHLAARPVSAFARGHEDDYVSLAVNTILRDEPKEGYGRMDYAARLNDFDRTMDELFDRLSPDGVAEDREVLSQVCWGMFLSFDNGLKSRDKLEGTVDRLKALIQEGRAAGARLPRKDGQVGQEQLLHLRCAAGRGVLRPRQAGDGVRQGPRARHEGGLARLRAAS